MKRLFNFLFVAGTVIWCCVSSSQGSAALEVPAAPVVDGVVAAPVVDGVVAALVVDVIPTAAPVGRRVVFVGYNSNGDSY